MADTFADTCWDNVEERESDQRCDADTEDNEDEALVFYG